MGSIGSTTIGAHRRCTIGLAADGTLSHAGTGFGGAADALGENIPPRAKEPANKPANSNRRIFFPFIKPFLPLAGTDEEPPGGDHRVTSLTARHDHRDGSDPHQRPPRDDYRQREAARIAGNGHSRERGETAERLVLSPLPLGVSRAVAITMRPRTDRARRPPPPRWGHRRRRRRGGRSAPGCRRCRRRDR
jgi:hypothetical protein